MKKLIILALLAYGFYKYWPMVANDNIAPLYNHPYVVVYGRDSCGWTQAMRQQLKSTGIPFEYRVVDDSRVADPLHERMTATGLDVRRYNLPVVDISGNLVIRPEPEQVIAGYRAAGG